MFVRVCVIFGQGVIFIYFDKSGGEFFFSSFFGVKRNVKSHDNKINVVV